MNKGEIVIAKTTSADNEAFQKREEGKAYKIQEIIFCESCDVECINIGETVEFGLMECSCGHLQSNFGLKWTATIHFEEPNSITKNEAISLALQDEDYELCAKYRDL